MKKWLFAALAIAAATPAAAQNAVTQSGSIIVNHLAKWKATRQIGDVGGLLGDNTGIGASPFAITDNLGCGLQINSAPTTGPYSALCLGHDSNGDGLISFDNFNGAPDTNLYFLINGVRIPIGAINITGVPAVPDNATLSTLPAATNSVVIRRDHSIGLGAPPIFFVAMVGNCAANGMTNDAGSCTNASDGGSFKAQYDFLPDIRQWGCRPNDTVDIVPCMVAAYNAKLGPIYIPQGVWRVASAATFTDHNPSFVGAGWAEFNQNAACPTTANVQGTWLHRGAANTGVLPFTISGGATPGSGGFKNMAFCEDHPAPTAGWAPTTYQPWISITGNGGEIGLNELYLYAVYNFLNYKAPAGSGNGRLDIRNIRGQVFNTFLDMDRSFDVVHGGNWHLWPFWSTNPDVVKWQQANATVLVIRRVDGFTVDDAFFYGYHTGIMMAGGSSGVTIFTNFGSYYCDACVWGIEGVSDNNVLQIGNAYLGGGDLPFSNGIITQDNSSGQQIMIGTLHCTSFGESCIRLVSGGTSNTVHVGSAWMHDINKDNTGKPFLYAGAGHTIRIANKPTFGGSNNGAAIADVAAGGEYEMSQSLEYRGTALAGSTAAGTWTLTEQNGFFQKLGDTVTLQFTVTWSAMSGATGDLLVTGLPYKSTTLPIFSGYCNFATSTHVTYSPSYIQMFGQIGSNVNYAQIRQNGPSVDSIALPVTALPAAGTLVGICIYRSI